MNIKSELNTRVEEIDKIIAGYLPAEEDYQKTIMEAMNYSIQGGGKRIRPLLMIETYRLFGGNDEVIRPFMAALEMIHTYSLVHDDLPAMDNDDYRRGRKTTHIVYGEGMAILAGDSLLNFAFETAAKAFFMEADLQRTARALEILSHKAGIYGMIGGQTADILAEEMRSEEITEDLLLYIHKNKTAALIESAMMIGAVLAGASIEEVSKIEKIAYNIGVAFQIQDDILDVTGTLESLGKMAGSDEKNNKVTYVTLNGLEKAKEDVRILSEEAIELLDSLPSENQFLKSLIEELITREK